MARAYDALLGRLAAEFARLAPAQVQAAFQAQQRERPTPPIEIVLVERGLVSHAQMADLLAKQSEKLRAVDARAVERTQLWQNAAQAAKNGWASPDDVNRALREHARREDAREPWVALGQLMADLGLLRTLGAAASRPAAPAAPGFQDSDEPTILSPMPEPPSRPQIPSARQTPAAATPPARTPVPRSGPTGSDPTILTSLPEPGPHRPASATPRATAAPGSEPTVRSPLPPDLAPHRPGSPTPRATAAPSSEPTVRSPLPPDLAPRKPSPSTAWPTGAPSSDPTVESTLPPGLVPRRPASPTPPVTPAARLPESPRRPLPVDQHGTSEPVFPAARFTRTQSKLVGRWIGKYWIESEIGRGGMGVVYRAVHSERKVPVALKILLKNDPAARRAAIRFQQEAVAASKLQHPGIVRVLEAGEDGGYTYIAMELVEGTTLDRVLDHPEHIDLEGAEAVTTGRTGLPQKAAVVMARQIAEAIHYAHEVGVVHRDLKPSNVLRDRAGRLKVMDFGLAKVVSDGDGGITGSGAVLGTPGYMSPELADGKSSTVDARSDVYQIGAILYELLTGHPPYEGSSSVETVLRIVSGETPPPPTHWNPAIDPDVETLCLVAMAREPEQRYQTARAFAEDCAHWLAGRAVLGRA